MKKVIMYGLGTLTVLTWSVVILLVIPGDDLSGSEEHSQMRTPVKLEENIDFAGVSEKINELRSSNKARTVFGEQVITDEWKKDVADNGRVSIDTVLRSLDSNG
ncbi:hypothetical protein [Salimicrobium halophilum]|uniref:Uncharacterized protein n=1 Tax=Salimicrobium halophilum TaxID=86666 RepID=A0A1G8VIX8_9BACI|nr:hypothetical protein [Salimicrobium halophilum]SDJ66008.1 hypothetical protein SAMN04490247_2733 [Salimicrobium halophilum]